MLLITYTAALVKSSATQLVQQLLILSPDAIAAAEAAAAPARPCSTDTGTDAVAVLQNVATPEYPGPGLLGLKAKNDSLHVKAEQQFKHLDAQAKDEGTSSSMQN